MPAPVLAVELPQQQVSAEVLAAALPHEGGVRCQECVEVAPAAATLGETERLLLEVRSERQKCDSHGGAVVEDSAFSWDAAPAWVDALLLGEADAGSPLPVLQLRPQEWEWSEDAVDAGEGLAQLVMVPEAAQEQVAAAGRVCG